MGDLHIRKEAGRVKRLPGLVDLAGGIGAGAEIGPDGIRIHALVALHHNGAGLRCSRGGRHEGTGGHRNRQAHGDSKDSGQLSHHPKRSSHLARNLKFRCSENRTGVRADSHPAKPLVQAFTCGANRGGPVSPLFGATVALPPRPPGPKPITLTSQQYGARRSMWRRSSASARWQGRCESRCPGCVRSADARAQPRNRKREDGPHPRAEWERG